MEEVKRQLNREEYLDYIERWKIENKKLIASGKCKKVFLECLPRCRSQIKWKESVNSKIYFIYEDIKGWLNLTKCFRKNSRTRLLIKYNTKEFDLTTSSLTECILGKFLDIYTDKFKYEIGQKIIDKKRDITITDRKYFNNINNENGWAIKYKYYKYKCNKCDFDCGEHYKNQELRDEFWILEADLKHGVGCSTCCPNPQIVVEGINDIPTIAPFMIPYFQGGYDEAKKYNAQSNKEIHPVCPSCKRVRSKSYHVSHIYKYDSIGCSCSDRYSFPNKTMFNILEQLNIDFETEYSPDWIKPKAYDFYFKINNKEYIIEMDGGFHYKYNSMSGQSREESKFIDDEKDKLAKEHGIEVIRIDCNYNNNNDRFKYVKNNILTNCKARYLFDFSNIDWIQCEKFTSNNLIKMACEHKRNNPDMTSAEIGKVLKFHGNTIIRWLKQGNKLGWCKYNPKEEMAKNGCKNSPFTEKPIAIFKGENMIGLFLSAQKLDKESEKLFGIKLDFRGISSVCNINSKRPRNSYRGFKFKFVKDLTEEEYKKYDIDNKLKELNKSA